MPRMVIAGGTRFTPASSRSVKPTPACWLAAPSQAKTPGSDTATSRTTTATSRASRRATRPGDGTDQEVVEPGLATPPSVPR